MPSVPTKLSRRDPALLELLVHRQPSMGHGQGRLAAVHDGSTIEMSSY